jgi:hypothetical protein
MRVGDVTAPGGGKAFPGRGGEAVRLLAGLADFGLEQAEGMLRRARGALSRADYSDLAADAHEDLLARGDVVLARFAPAREAHMETLARIAKQNRGIPVPGGE